jgi:uncharacterized protein with HEPN domain
LTYRETRRLRYILDAIELIEVRTTSGKKDFLENLDEQDAVLWRLYTLADASVQLPRELQERHPVIPWERIRGFRNVAAHGYLDLLMEIAWEVIEIHLPLLRAAVEQEIQRSESGET